MYMHCHVWRDCSYTHRNAVFHSPPTPPSTRPHRREPTVLPASLTDRTSLSNTQNISIYVYILPRMEKLQQFTPKRCLAGPPHLPPPHSPTPPCTHRVPRRAGASRKPPEQTLHINICIYTATQEETAAARTETWFFVRPHPPPWSRIPLWTHRASRCP